jgi:lambda family phage holin
MKMIDKDPGFWSGLLDLFGPEARSAVMAAIISVLRILYDEKESKWQRIGLESLLCGALAYGLSSGLAFFSLDTGLSVFCGATLGFFGVEFVRNRAQRYVDNKVDSIK